MKGTVPSVEDPDSYPVVMIDVSGEGLIYDDNNVPVRGITNVDGGFDSGLGSPAKRFVRTSVINRNYKSKKLDFWMDAGLNDLFGNYKGDGKIISLNTAICHENIRQLYYDMSVLFDLYHCLEADSARKLEIIYDLNDASNVLSVVSKENIKKAREILKRSLDKKNGDPSLTFTAIGHSHLDLAWLWPLRETKRKGARTFSTVLEMMDRYPEYIFGASQAQLYEWIKEGYPDIYEQIKVQVKNGRWDLQGPTWVECDTNITGGESLIRQFLYGKEFFMKEFSKDIRILWLPDVFGYSGAIPQIMKKSGVDYFMTQKLSWNEYNKFPNHTFIWKGIDGSSVLAHMLPEDTYNGPVTPHGIKYAEKIIWKKEYAMRRSCFMELVTGEADLALVILKDIEE